MNRFELGQRPLKRNSPKDWEAIWESSKKAAYEEIPADVRFRSFRTINDIARKYTKAEDMERDVYVYWGETGKGKTRKARYYAGKDAYIKCSSNKYWDGYDGEENVIIDEFTGLIGIYHLLRWTDRYAVNFEVKHSAAPSVVKRIWITSNLPINEWWPDAKDVQLRAFKRRVKEIEHFTPLSDVWTPPEEVEVLGLD